MTTIERHWCPIMNYYCSRKPGKCESLDLKKGIVRNDCEYKAKQRQNRGEDDEIHILPLDNCPADYTRINVPKESVQETLDNVVWKDILKRCYEE